MRQLEKIAFLFLFLLFLGGCSNLRGAKLMAPESFGLRKVEDSLYVEETVDEATIQKLQEAIKKAETEVRAIYGGVISHPIVNACVTEQCYKDFGGMGSKAKAYGDHILLSERGHNWHYVAHEWSHVEMQARLTFLAWGRLPQWFDEAVAVVVSQAPDHSESHWNFLVQSGIKRPTREELLSYKSLRQWLDAVRFFGATRNDERRARGESEIHPVYAAAGHELRPWLEKVGSNGFLDLIRRLNEGERFGAIYK